MTFINDTFQHGIISWNFLQEFKKLFRYRFYLLEFGKSDGTVKVSYMFFTVSEKKNVQIEIKQLYKIVCRSSNRKHTLLIGNTIKIVFQVNWSTPNCTRGS